jgi:CheY-like chemotaxis protein
VARLHRILLVDDETSVRTALHRSLEPEGYDVLEAGTAEAAIEVLRENAVDVVIADHCMPDMEGLELLDWCRTFCHDSMRVLLTGHAELGLALRAINGGIAHRFLLKPWDDVDLRRTLTLAIRQLLAGRRDAYLLSLLRERGELDERALREHPEMFCATDP